MKTVKRNFVLGPVALAIVSAVVSAWPGAAAEKPATPDFSGAWGRNVFNFEPPDSGPGPIGNLRRIGPDASVYITGGDPVPLVGDYMNPILKPQAAEVVKKNGEWSASGHDIPDPSNQCANWPPPFALQMQQIVRILPSKSKITMIYSQDDQVRHIWMNAAHPKNLKPSSMGHSVGHYEGDTLVVDTVGIEVGPYTIVDRFGTPQSPAMHVVERYRFIDVNEAAKAQERQEAVAGRLGGKAGNTKFDADYPKGLQLEIMVDDPGVYTTPWGAKITYRRTPIEWEERRCAENNTNILHPDFAHVPTAEKADF